MIMIMIMMVMVMMRMKKICDNINKSKIKVKVVTAKQRVKCINNKRVRTISEPCEPWGKIEIYDIVNT